MLNDQLAGEFFLVFGAKIGMKRADDKLIIQSNGNRIQRFARLRLRFLQGKTIEVRERIISTITVTFNTMKDTKASNKCGR
jgi:hypothetical protein